MNAINVTYRYSLNKTYFVDKNEMINILKEEYDEDELKNVTIIRGIKQCYTHETFLNSTDIIEELTNSAYEESEYSENYIEELEREIHKTNLNKVILEYLNKNVSQPTFFKIKDIETITYNEFIGGEDNAK